MTEQNLNAFPAAIVFDLDGTLVDSAYDLCSTLNWVLKQEGRAEVSMASLRHMVGRGARVLLREAWAATGEPASEAELDRLVPIFLDYYSAHIADKTVVFDGVPEVLAAFRERGVKLAVCTNKAERLARQLLDALGLSPLFDAILGGDSLSVRKPDPGHILGALSAMGMDTAGAVMVGDSIHDIDAAKGAGIPVVAVTFGYSDQPVEGLGANVVINVFRDLPKAISGLI